MMVGFGRAAWGRLRATTWTDQYAQRALNIQRTSSSSSRSSRALKQAPGFSNQPVVTTTELYRPAYLDRKGSKSRGTWGRKRTWGLGRVCAEDAGAEAGTAVTGWRRRLWVTSHTFSNLDGPTTQGKQRRSDGPCLRGRKENEEKEGFLLGADGKVGERAEGEEQEEAGKRSRLESDGGREVEAVPGVPWEELREEAQDQRAKGASDEMRETNPPALRERCALQQPEKILSLSLSSSLGSGWWMDGGWMDGLATLSLVCCPLSLVSGLSLSFSLFTCSTAKQVQCIFGDGPGRARKWCPASFLGLSLSFSLLLLGFCVVRAGAGRSGLEVGSTFTRVVDRPRTWGVSLLADPRPTYPATLLPCYLATLLPFPTVYFSRLGWYNGQVKCGV